MKKKLAAAGFSSPNFTQTPNDFFKLINDMEDAELRVTLVMIRETFGYHRESFTMGLNKMAAAAGLSRNGAKAGAEAAEQRGTFKRANPDAQGSAQWELVVALPEEAWSEDAWSASDQGGGQPVTTPWSTTDQQSRLKESNKEINKSTTTPARLYEENIGPLTPLISDALRDAEKTFTAEWTCRAIKEAAASNARSMKYINAILAGYKQRGGPDIGRSKAPTRAPKKQQVDIDAVLGVS